MAIIIPLYSHGEQKSTMLNLVVDGLQQQKAISPIRQDQESEATVNTGLIKLNTERLLKHCLSE